MIPNNRALVPLSHSRWAAQQAILEVEDRLARGKRPGRYPFAVALIKQLRGEKHGRITARDIRLAASEYVPSSRDGSPAERYMCALDVLIESRGRFCPLPLSDRAVEEYFPEMKFRTQERMRRRQDVHLERRGRQRTREQEQKRRRYQNRVGQAQIELAFVTPAQLPAWYRQQERNGIFDDDLIGMVQTWSQRFSIDHDAFQSGQPLWSIVSGMNDTLTARTVAEQWVDSVAVPNKLRHNRGTGS